MQVKEKGKEKKQTIYFDKVKKLINFLTSYMSDIVQGIRLKHDIDVNHEMKVRIKLNFYYTFHYLFTWTW